MTATNRLNTGARCVAYVDGDLIAPTYKRSRGFSGQPFRNGAGDLTLTLAEPIDTLTGDLLINAGVESTGFASLSVEIVDSTHLRVRGFDNADGISAADLNFWISLGEIGPN